MIYLWKLFGCSSLSFYFNSILRSLFIYKKLLDWIHWVVIIIICLSFFVFYFFSFLLCTYKCYLLARFSVPSVKSTCCWMLMLIELFEYLRKKKKQEKLKSQKELSFVVLCVLRSSSKRCLTIKWLQIVDFWGCF